MEDNFYDVAVHAKRGYIYQWRSLKDETKYNYCLVLSNDTRQNSNLISILFLSPYKQISSDCVRLEFGNGDYCVRTGLVTYTPRACLMEWVARVPDDTMQTIDAMVSRELGLPTATETMEYKRLYNELLDKVVNDR